MIRTSYKKLNDESLDKIFDLFFEIVAHNRSRLDFIDLIGDILTPAEKNAIAKRVVIMYLTLKGVPQRDAAKSLRASIGTVSRYAYVLDKSNKLREIMMQLLKRERAVQLLDDLFSQLFIQPGIYKNHWALYQEYKRRKNKRQTSGI